MTQSTKFTAIQNGLLDYLVSEISKIHFLLDFGTEYMWESIVMSVI